MKNTCFACNTQRTPRGLLYDINTFKTYCRTEASCHNPNERPKELYDLDHETIEQFYNEDMSDAINRLLGKPTSVRLTPYLIKHVLNVAEKHEFTSISEVILYILGRDFAVDEAKNVELEIAAGIPWEPKVKKLKATVGKEWEPTASEPVSNGVHYSSELEPELQEFSDNLVKQHEEMEQNTPVATPKVQEIIDQVQKVIDEQEDDDFEI